MGTNIPEATQVNTKSGHRNFSRLPSAITRLGAEKRAREQSHIFFWGEGGGGSGLRVARAVRGQPQLTSPAAWSRQGQPPVTRRESMARFPAPLPMPRGQLAAALPGRPADLPCPPVGTFRQHGTSPACVCTGWLLWASVRWPIRRLYVGDAPGNITLPKHTYGRNHHPSSPSSPVMEELP